MKGEDSPELRGDPDEMALRIRQRRAELGVGVRELADLTGVSPSYISLIENGRKIPTPEVARRLALALKDDQGLYVAWAEAVRQRTLQGTQEALARFEARLESPRMDVRVVSSQAVGIELHPGEEFSGSEDWQVGAGTGALEEAGDETSLQMPPLFDGIVSSSPPRSIRRWLTRGESPPKSSPRTLGTADEPGASGGSFAEPTPELQKMRQLAEDAITSSLREIPIPLVPEGVDPHVGGIRIRGLLRVERSALPRAVLKRIRRPFGWRLSSLGVRRVADTLKPGDFAVFSDDGEPVVAGEIYALRYRGGVVLSRVLAKGRHLVLLSSQGQEDIDVLPSDEDSPDIPVVARVAAVIRPLRYGVFVPGERPSEK